MSSGLLFTPPNYFRAQRAQIAAQYSGFKLTIAKYEAGKSDAALVKKGFPQNCLPAFECGKEKLFEANAIAQFIANDQLRGGDQPARRAEVVQYANWSSAAFVPPMTAWVLPCLGVTQQDDRQVAAAKAEVKSALEYLNNLLATRTYLVGERITLADICVACDLLLLFRHVLDPAFRQPFPNVVRWFTTIVNQPEVKKVVGDVQLASKMATFDQAKYNQLHQQQSKQEQSKKKEQQPKKEQPKKEQPKKAAEEEEPKKKEDKDPFLALPAGTFIMDEFKRTISNDDIKTVALPYFWEKFDSKHYSIWYCEHAYPEELRMTFMSCNLISGMFQRLERMRKHAFGSVCLFGSHNNSTISGVWIWRGQDLAFNLSEDLQVDYESYKWTKLDPAAAETKKLVEGYFMQDDGDFGGKNLVECKVFK